MSAADLVKLPNAYFGWLMKAFREHRARPTVITSWKMRWFVLNVRFGGAKGRWLAMGSVAHRNAKSGGWSRQATTHTLYYFKQPTDEEARDVEDLEGCHMQPFLDNSEGAKNLGSPPPIVHLPLA